MREDEANFIGILACTESDDAYFRYSGYLMAWVHAGNALAKADVESFYELHSQLDVYKRQSRPFIVRIIVIWLLYLTGIYGAMTSRMEKV